MERSNLEKFHTTAFGDADLDGEGGEIWRRRFRHLQKLVERFARPAKGARHLRNGSTTGRMDHLRDSQAATYANSHAEIKLPDEVIVVELVGGLAFEGDLAVHDDVARIGDAQRLGEVLLGHEHGE